MHRSFNPQTLTRAGEEVQGTTKEEPKGQGPQKKEQQHEATSKLLTSKANALQTAESDKEKLDSSATPNKSVTPKRLEHESEKKGPKRAPLKTSQRRPRHLRKEGRPRGHPNKSRGHPKKS